MPKDKIKKLAEKYAKILSKNKFNFKHIYLYGSQATGKAHKYSDIDLAIIVNKAGRGKEYFDKTTKLLKWTSNVDNRIEPLLLENKDLKVGSRSMMGYEVKKHGILIK